MLNSADIWLTGRPSPLQGLRYTREFSPGETGERGKDEIIRLKPRENKGKITDGYLEIPLKIQNKLAEHFSIKTIVKNILCLLVAESENKVLKITFLPSNTIIAKISISLRSRNLSNISKNLGDQKLNILESKFTIFGEGTLIWKIIISFNDSEDYKRIFNQTGDKRKALLQKLNNDLNQGSLVGKESVQIEKIFGEPDNDEATKDLFTSLKNIESKIRDILRKFAKEHKKWKENKQYIPEDIIISIENRFNKSVNKMGDDEFIEKLDFGLYIKIFEKKNNMNQLIPGINDIDKSHLLVALREIKNLRDTLYHLRPITEYDINKFKVFQEIFDNIIIKYYKK